MKKEFVRNPYNYDSDELSDETGLSCKDPSLTSQEFVQESDINYIADRFMRTGEIKTIVDMPTSGDFRGTFDFQSAMNLIKSAKDEFMSLPAKIRSRFDNDPAKLIDFLEQDDENSRAEAIALGLIKPKESNESRTQGIPPKPEETKKGATRAPTAAPGTQGKEVPGSEAG